MSSSQTLQGPQISRKDIGYQSMVLFVFIATTVIMIASTIMVSTNAEIEKDGSRDTILGLLGASTGIMGIFTLYLLRGFYSSAQDREGLPFQYFNPNCEVDLATRTLKPLPVVGEAPPGIVGIQTFLLFLFVIVFALVLTSIIMINGAVNDESDRRDLNGLLGFSVSWIGFFALYMGYNFKFKGYPLEPFSPKGCVLG